MPMKRVFLTGAYNLAGSHILDQLLSFNVSVRAVVGSRDEAQALEQQYTPKSNTLLDFAIIPPKDRSAPGAYDEALDGYPGPFDTVIHTVAANPSEGADCLTRFIHLETETLLNFLRSVNYIAKNVRRVIITTSLTPFARWLVDPQVERSPRGGNPTSQRAPEIDTEYVLATSRASDNIIHDEIWKWAKDTHARFDLVSLTAPSIYGPSIRPLTNSTDLEEANRRIWNICSNDSTETVTSPPYGIDYFTDVRDFAFAHVQAVLIPEASNKRFTVSAGMMPRGPVIAEFLRNRFPEFGSRIQPDTSPPRRTPAEEQPLELVDTTPAATILGLVRYRPIEETLTDLARQILELHRRKEWRSVIQS
ncbi:NAD(P)-binding protein [Zopfia rhizophila CBS 207.26]|uniref:NAD(P)-binding protein n=1 Tax=Zopfia rhizophila CBS 207.26 TaxID=1314779 RepID=A0A6A6EVH0_9PEZI|nr:NAD(P)-binding protein [Zopfia rhizophila CBS 207.26]